MKIGLTCNLRDEYLARGFSEEETAEFDSPVTIGGIESALVSLGYGVERIGGIERLVSMLCKGKRWDMVFNIAEGMNGIGRESQIPGLLDAYRIPYTFSDPMVLSLSLHKAMTKRVVRDLGLNTPDFAVVSSMDDVRGIKAPFPLFAKPLAEGTSKGVYGDSIIQTRDQLWAVCWELLHKFDQPVLVEAFLPGREFTVGLTGTGREARVLGVMEVVLGKGAEAGVYSYLNKAEYEERVTYRLADDSDSAASAALALAAWRGLECRDAGRVDVRLDHEGRASFIEVNPLPGLNPVHSDLPILCGLQGMKYEELIALIMESALSRAGLERPSKAAATITSASRNQAAYSVAGMA